MLQAEANASRFLANIENGMTDSQRLRAVLLPYANWIEYKGGGQVMDEALTDGASVCGGNARGSIYLSQRMGIKAYWVRTDSHAWSNVKLNRDDSGITTENGNYYRIDLLAGTSCFISEEADHAGFRGHHKAVHFNRMKGYPDMVSKSYPYAWTGWSNVTISVEDSWVVLSPDDASAFDAPKLIKSATSIYDGTISDSVSIDFGGLKANNEGLFDPGYYKLTFTARDARGNSATGTVNVQVVDGEVIKANAENCETNTGSTFLPDSNNNLSSLWNGLGEVVYSYGISQNDGNKSVTYKVDRGDATRLTYLDAWVGLHRSTRDSEYGIYGKVGFYVKATVVNEAGETEEQVLYTSSDMTRYTVQEHVLVKIPDNALTVTLTSDSLGSGNGHTRWGNPRFFTSDILDEVPVAPAISNIEDGATYKNSVTPVVEGATEVSLYRKNLPTIVDPDSGTVVVDTDADDNDSSSDSKGISKQSYVMNASSDSSDWGTKVEDYQCGDPISEEGIYTLVARNKYMQSIVTFTILSDTGSGSGDDDDDSADGDTGGESGDGSGDGTSGGTDDDDSAKPDDDTNAGADNNGNGGSGDNNSGGSQTPGVDDSGTDDSGADDDLDGGEDPGAAEHDKGNESQNEEVSSTPETKDAMFTIAVALGALALGFSIIACVAFARSSANKSL